jgi:hypothetical protein
MAAQVSEKADLLPTSVPEIKRSKCVIRKLHLVPLLLVALALYHFGCLSPSSHGEEYFDEDVKQKLCPQPSPLVPVKNGELWTALGKSYETTEFQKRAINLLSGAVQIPCVSSAVVQQKMVTLTLRTVGLRVMIKCSL